MGDIRYLFTNPLFSLVPGFVVKINKNRQLWKRTPDEKGEGGRIVVEASNGLRSAEFTAYSLLFTVPAGGPEWQFCVIPGAASGCVESSVARHVLKKKFAVKFADKFAVPGRAVNCEDYAVPIRDH